MISGKRFKTLLPAALQQTPHAHQRPSFHSTTYNPALYPVCPRRTNELPPILPDTYVISTAKRSRRVESRTKATRGGYSKSAITVPPRPSVLKWQCTLYSVFLN